MKSIFVLLMLTVSVPVFAILEDFPTNLKLNQYQEVQKQRFAAVEIGSIVVVDSNKVHTQMHYYGKVPSVSFERVLDKKDGKVLIRQTWVEISQIHLPVEQLRLPSGKIVKAGSQIEVVGRAAYDGAMQPEHIDFVPGRIVDLYEKGIARVHTIENVYPEFYSMELARTISDPVSSGCPRALAK